MKKLEWNIFYHSINDNTIKIANIFDHGRYKTDVLKSLKKCKTKEEFAKKLKSDTMYYFWSKCEWETIIKNWVGSECEIKIDVYWQVKLNWDKFVDYVWNSKRVYDEAK